MLLKILFQEDSESFAYLVNFSLTIEIRCVQGLYLWRNSSSEVNAELYKGYRKGNLEEKINEFVAGWSSQKFKN